MINVAARTTRTLSGHTMSQTEGTVYVVDDDISVRESLAALVRFAGWPVLVFPSAEAFLDQARGSAPGCLVLDVALPDLNGLDLQARLRREKAALPIIFITGFGDVPMSVRAMKAGAIEFLAKPLDDEALLAAIAEAVASSAAALATQTSVEQLRQDFAGLSNRERQVMTLISAGLLNKQVARELGISEITVKAHRGRVMRKMHARSFAELINMATTLALSSGRQH